jgi:hypothetical protein
VAVERVPHVTFSRDRSGDYVVVEERDDGALVVAPDTSADAMLRRLDMTPATLDELEAEYGPIQPPDGEGEFVPRRSGWLPAPRPKPRLR